MGDELLPVPDPENPELFTGLKLGKIKQAAAGIPAVWSSFKMVISEAGLLRGNKALFHLNKKGGYDCPSCAWPDPDDERSGIAEYCENGARAVADEATSKKLTAAFFEQHSVFDLSLLSDYEIGRQGRIAQPMYLPKGASHYQPISWKEAFDKIAIQLNILSSPDEAVFYTSGRTSNEAAFLYQLFVREYGTNNLPRLQQYVPRKQRCGPERIAGHWQGIGKTGGFLRSRSHYYTRAKPGHQPSQDAFRFAKGQEEWRCNYFHQPFA